MLQVLGLLVISWLIVWLFDKRDLSVLGLVPTRKRAILAIILLLVTAICCSTAFLLRIYFAKEQYILNPNLTPGILISGTWDTLRGVLTEELICRGVLLYIMIKKLGSKWAILISSVVFALLHWLNAGVIGNPDQMILVFTFTFAMGLLLAYSYARTFSILIPTAIHFGWNYTQNFVFPEGMGGNHIFIMESPPPVVTVSYFTFLFLMLFPKISAVLLDFAIIRRQKQVGIPS